MENAENTVSESAQSAETSPIQSALQIAASGVQSVSMGGRTITNANVKDLIELDKYQNQRAAAGAIGLGFEAGVRPGSTRF